MSSAAAVDSGGSPEGGGESDVSRDTWKGLWIFLIGTLGRVLKAARGDQHAQYSTV